MYDSDNLKQESKERIKTKVHLKQTLTEKGQFDPKSNMSLFFPMGCIAIYPSGLFCCEMSIVGTMKQEGAQRFLKS